MPNYSFSRVKSGSLTTVTTRMYPNGTPIVTSSTVQTVLEGVAGSSQGVVTPGYFVLRENGRLPVNPYKYSNDKYVVPVVNRSYTSRYTSTGMIENVTETGTVSQSNPGYSAVTRVYDGSKLISSALRESESRALADLKSQKINVAQFIAERKQTINLIASSAMKIAGFLIALKKGDIISAGKALGSRPSRKIRRGYRELKTQSVRDATADAWLAMQYGWKPLLSDIYGAVDMLNEAQSDFQRLMSKSRAHRSDTQNFKFSDGFGYWDVNITYRCVVKHTYMFDVTQSSIQTLGRIGLTNPNQLAWELIPYSFVVDWFVPIGNYLSTLDATMGLSFVQGSLVIFEEQKTEAVWIPQSAGTTNAYGTGKGTRKLTRISRERLSSFPLPQFPEFKNPFSVTHVLNALALLSGAASRRAG